MALDNPRVGEGSVVPVLPPASTILLGVHTLQEL